MFKPISLVSVDFFNGTAMAPWLVEIMIIKLNLQLIQICLLYWEQMQLNEMINIKCKKYVDNVEYINRQT